LGEAPTNTNFEFSLNNPRSGKRYPLMRPNAKYGFLFDFEVPEDDATSVAPRVDRPMVQFIDDTDLSWRIDDNLRLQRIEAPGASWTDLFSWL